MKRKPTKGITIGAVVVAALIAIPVFNVVTGDSAKAADARPGDGTTSATAGASCWGIKQQYPASANGTYWLNTAVLQRPQQFACDMTTDGGGWVLVGRGRNGWSFNPLGQGSAATVRTTTDGAGAFAPAALDTTSITALLNGTNVNALTDGIRLERATNSAGTKTQDYRLYPKYAQWTWSFPAGQLLNKVTVDGTTYAGSNSANTNATAYGQTTNGLSGATGTRQLNTTAVSNKNKVQGFGFGTGVGGGSNSSSNFLWTYASEGSPLPFTKVWIRPRVANDAAGFTPLPSAGLPAAPMRPVLRANPRRRPGAWWASTTPTSPPSSRGRPTCCRWRWRATGPSSAAASPACRTDRRPLRWPSRTWQRSTSTETGSARSGRRWTGGSGTWSRPPTAS
jgi:hypothetical protein